MTILSKTFSISVNAALELIFHRLIGNKQEPCKINPCVFQLSKTDAPSMSARLVKPGQERCLFDALALWPMQDGSAMGYQNQYTMIGIRHYKRDIGHADG